MMATRKPDLEELLSHRDIVYSVARNMCGYSSEAEEITLKTFASACEWLPSAMPRPNLRTWLCGIAANISLIRAASHPKVPIASAREHESNELSELLRRALDQLEARVRAVFVLCDLASLTAEETANILQASPREIRIQLHRARLALREVLDAFFKQRMRGHAPWLAGRVTMPE